MTEGTATGEPASTSGSAEHDPGSSHLGLALVLISAAQTMIVLDGTVVNIALPHIQTSLGFSQQNLQWVVTGYTLTFGGLLLLGGRSGDLLGRRRMFMVGLAALSTVAYGVFRTKIEPELFATQGHPSAQATAVASTHGYTAAFVVAAMMLLSAAVITLIGLSIKHDELATDDPGGPER
jgi:MFS family permease